MMNTENEMPADMAIGHTILDVAGRYQVGASVSEFMHELNKALEAAGYVIVSKAYLDTDLLNSAMVLKAINEAQTQESRQPEG